MPKAKRSLRRSSAAIGRGESVEWKLSPKGFCALRHKLHVVKHMQAVKKKRSQTAVVEQKKILLKNLGKNAEESCTLDTLWGLC